MFLPFNLFENLGRRIYKFYKILPRLGITNYGIHEKSEAGGNKAHMQKKEKTLIMLRTLSQREFTLIPQAILLPRTIEQAMYHLSCKDKVLADMVNNGFFSS